MRRSNLATLLYLAVVFASGIVVGGFANRLYMMKTVSASVSVSPPRNHAEIRKHYLEEMTSRLHLTEPQIAQLKQIMDVSDQHLHELRKSVDQEHRQKVFAMLNDDQKTEYQKMVEEREKRHQEQARKGQ